MDVFVHTYHFDHRAFRALRGIGFNAFRINVLEDPDYIFNTPEHLYQLALRHPKVTWMYCVPEDNQAFMELVRMTAGLTNVQFDLGIEADLVKFYWESPWYYALKVNSMARAIRGYHDCVITVNTLSKVTKKGLIWVSNLVPRLDAGIEISIHAYRKSVWDSCGFGNLDTMFNSIKKATLNRDWYNTETGWHSATGGLCKFWPWLAERLGLKCRRSEEQIGFYLVNDIRLHKAWGCKAYVVYQAYTGPSDIGEERFGLLDLNLEPKARAYILGDYLREQDKMDSGTWVV